MLGERQEIVGRRQQLNQNNAALVMSLDSAVINRTGIFAVRRVV
jgi:hypothetical protein